MKITFEKVIASVYSMLGITKFEKSEDGTPCLTDEQAEALKKAYGQSFVEQFTKDLAAHKTTPEAAADANKYKEELDALQAQFATYKADSTAKIENLTGLVQTLSAEPEPDLKVEIPASSGQKHGFKVNANFLHNKVVENFVHGDGLMALATDTIDTTELRKEFGDYVATIKYEIHTLLFGKLECTKYMTTKMTENTEWRAVQGQIDNLMQKFTPYWTPSGTVKFNPLVIKNRKHKINLPVKPAEIMTDVLGHLYDEGLEPKDMPIVKYIVEVLLKPKIEEEREEKLTTDVYDDTIPEDLRDNAEGSVGGCLDGFVTILEQLHKDSNVGMVRLLNGVTLTRANIYDKFDEIYKAIPKNYRTKSLNIFIDSDLLNLYELARDDKFPNSKNEDENKKRLQHTNFTFTPLPGMTGTGVFFITPTENFIHLLSKNKGASKIWFQGENYDVKIFAEWWESVGFAIAELLFGYVPPVKAPAGSGGGQTA